MTSTELATSLAGFLWPGWLVRCLESEPPALVNSVVSCVQCMRPPAPLASLWKPLRPGFLPQEAAPRPPTAAPNYPLAPDPGPAAPSPASKAAAPSLLLIRVQWSGPRFRTALGCPLPCRPGGMVWGHLPPHLPSQPGLCPRTRPSSDVCWVSGARVVGSCRPHTCQKKSPLCGSSEHGGLPFYPRCGGWGMPLHPDPGWMPRTKTTHGFIHTTSPGFMMTRSVSARGTRKRGLQDQRT